MSTVFPYASKILFKKERNIDIQRHKQRVRFISAHIDTSSPATFDIPAFNRKKLQMLEDKQTEIERENQILLNKITHIMKPSQQKPKTGSIMQQPVVFQKQGVNENKRKNELLKITMENQNILKRIKEKKSTYDSKKLAQQYQRHKYFKKNLCEYPVLTEINKNNLSNNNFNNLYSEASEQDEMSQSGQQYKQKKKPEGRKLEPVNDQPDENGVRVLAKKSKKIGINLYIIEVSIKEGIFRITADDVENPLTRVLEMFEDDGLRVLKEFFNDSIDQLFNNLKISDKIYIKGLEQYQEQEQIKKPPPPPIDDQVHSSRKQPPLKQLKSNQKVMNNQSFKKTPQKVISSKIQNNNNTSNTSVKKQQQQNQKQEQNKKNNSVQKNQKQGDEDNYEENEYEQEFEENEKKQNKPDIDDEYGDEDFEENNQKEEKKQSKDDDNEYEYEEESNEEEEEENKNKNQKAKQQNVVKSQGSDNYEQDDEYEEEIEEQEQDNSNNNQQKQQDIVEDDYEQDQDEEFDLDEEI